MKCWIIIIVVVVIVFIVIIILVGFYFVSIVEIFNFGIWFVCLIFVFEEVIGENISFVDWVVVVVVVSGFIFVVKLFL